MRTLTMAVMAGALLLAGPMAAQANEDCPMCGHMGMMDGDKKADKLGVLLDLTDAQKAEVKKLADAHAEKMKPMHEEHMKKMKQMKEEFKAGLNKILNEKQRAKLEAWKKMDDDGMGKKMDHPH